MNLARIACIPTWPSMHVMHRTGMKMLGMRLVYPEIRFDEKLQNSVVAFHRRPMHWRVAVDVLLVSTSTKLCRHLCDIKFFLSKVRVPVDEFLQR